MNDRLSSLLTTLPQLRRGSDLLRAKTERTAGLTDRTGALWECVGAPAGGGAQTLLEALLLEARQAGKFTALIDVGSGFDVDGLSPGLETGLLWVRCGELRQALRALDIVLRDENFHLVVLDCLGMGAGTAQAAPLTQWHRLRLLAKKRAAPLWVLSEQAQVPSPDERFYLPTAWPFDVLETPRQLCRERLLASLREQANKTVFQQLAG